MRRMAKRMVAVAALVLGVSPVEAATIWVGPGEPYPFTTIQAAIDAAAHGDVVMVADGVYTGPGNRDISFRGKRITVAGANGAESCIIDCNGTLAQPHRGFLFDSGEGSDSVLRGLTIRNGFAPAAPYEFPWWGVVDLWAGGAVACLDAGPTIEDCRFLRNTAKDYGGAVLAIGGTRLERCVFAHNRAKYGGAIEVIAFESYGGAVVVADSRFEYNAADREGGACRVSSSMESPVVHTVDNSTFVGNHAGRQGGAVVAYGRATVRHCVVVGNRAPRGGGFSADGDNYTAGPLRAEFCTFSGNRAAWGGAGAAEELGTLSLSHCILWGDEADEGPELAASYLDYKGRLAVAFCNLQGGQAGVSTPHPPSAWWGPGNMEACPCFASPGYWDANSTPDDQSDDFWVDGDYHLMSQAGRWLADEGRWTTDEVTSPCIDAGDPSRPVGSEPEPNGGRVNLGAYGGTDEASKSPPHTPWAADLNRDGTVDGADIAVISRNWLAESICTCIPGDVDGDGVVDFRDMAMVAADWLMQ